MLSGGVHKRTMIKTVQVDSRSVPRRRVVKAGVIAFPAGHITLPCIVRDISGGRGATACSQGDGCTGYIRVVHRTRRPRGRMRRGLADGNRTRRQIYGRAEKGCAQANPGRIQLRKTRATITPAQGGDPVTLHGQGNPWTIHDVNGNTLVRMSHKFSPPEGLDFLRGEVGAIIHWRKTDNREEYSPRHLQSPVFTHQAHQRVTNSFRVSLCAPATINHVRGAGRKTRFIGGEIDC